MSPVRVFILIIAAIAAIALAFVLRGAFGGKTMATAPIAAAPAPTPDKNSVQVLTAAHDMAVGVRVSASDFTWASWPASALNPAFITDGSAPAPAPTGAGAVTKSVSHTASSVMGTTPAQALEGSIVREPILSGEPIVKRKLVRAGDSGYMAVVLSPGMRAMALSVTVDSAAGGFILPGDRVDVMQAKQLDGSRGFSSQTILQNVRVLAIDQATEAASGTKALVGAVVTIEVPAGNAEMLARSAAEGKSGGGLTLALRSYADIGAPSGPKGGAGGGDGSTIHVYRAGQSSDVTVSR